VKYVESLEFVEGRWNPGISRVFPGLLGLFSVISRVLLGFDSLISRGFPGFGCILRD
jgi:hypothetical protein